MRKITNFARRLKPLGQKFKKGGKKIRDGFKRSLYGIATRIRASSK